MQDQNLLFVLFGVLFAFTGLNALLSAVLSFSYEKGVWRHLSYYWASVLALLILQAAPRTELGIILCITFSYVPITLLSRIPYLHLNEKFPWKVCLTAFALSYPAIFILQNYELGFVARSMPAAIAASLPAIFGVSLLFRRWKTMSVPLKALSVPLVTIIIHCYNFSLFRMVEDAQYWGWAVTFGIYQMLGVLLPAIVIEQSKRSEHKRLFGLVEERTAALSKAVESLEDEVEKNKELIKVVLHDISNPLTSLLGRLFLLKHQKLVKEDGFKHLDNALTSGDLLNAIIVDVRARQTGNLKKKLVNESGQKLEKSFQNLQTVYKEKLEQKQLELRIINSLPPDIMFSSDNTEGLTNSVFSNLLSNAIKFSHPKGAIEINLYLGSEEQVFIDIKDYGVGIPSRVAQDVEFGRSPRSSAGTEGEEGTGFGLLLAKSHIEKLGGQLLINPERQSEGSLLRLKLQVASRQRQPLDSSSHEGRQEIGDYCSTAKLT